MNYLRLYKILGVLFWILAVICDIVLMGLTSFVIIKLKEYYEGSRDPDYDDYIYDDYSSKWPKKVLKHYYVWMSHSVISGFLTLCSIIVIILVTCCDKWLGQFLPISYIIDVCALIMFIMECWILKMYPYTMSERTKYGKEAAALAATGVRLDVVKLNVWMVPPILGVSAMQIVFSTLGGWAMFFLNNKLIRLRRNNRPLNNEYLKNA